MTGDTKIARYLEAKRALETLKIARTDEPELVKDLAWRARFTAASVEASVAYGKLNGGELARAERQLREGPHGPDRA